jgi:hypothetical protein
MPLREEKERERSWTIGAYLWEQQHPVEKNKTVALSGMWNGYQVVDG